MSQKLHYQMISIEVTFQKDGEFCATLVQFFGQADTPNFPYKRIKQVESTAAHNLKESHGIAPENIVGMKWINVINLGEMTPEEFAGNTNATTTKTE